MTVKSRSSRGQVSNFNVAADDNLPVIAEFPKTNIPTPVEKVDENEPELN